MVTILNLFSKYDDRKTQISLFEKKNNNFNKGQDFAKKRNIDPMLAMKLNFQNLQIQYVCKNM
jgi:hypothetical protein